MGEKEGKREEEGGVGDRDITYKSVRVPLFRIRHWTLLGLF